MTDLTCFYFCRDELVVHPSWILDSIKAARLLPVEDYLLYQGRKAAQKVLNFTSKLHLSSTCSTTKSSPREVPTASIMSTSQSPWGGPSEDVSSTSILSPTREPSVSKLFVTSDQEQINDADDARAPLDISENDSVSREEEMLTENPTLYSESKIEKAGNYGQDTDTGTSDTTVKATTSSEITASKKSTDDSLFKKPSTSGIPRAGDPNFVSEFYSNSRLHYLSTWGAEFKKYTSDIIKSCAAKGLKGRGLGRVGPHGRVIMHIDMDSFFVSVTLRDQPHLRGKPIAVCHAGKSNTSAEQGKMNGLHQTHTPVAIDVFWGREDWILCWIMARGVL